MDAVDGPMVAQLQAEAVRGGTPALSLAVTSEFAIERTSEFHLTSEFAVPVADAGPHRHRRVPACSCGRLIAARRSRACARFSSSKRRRSWERSVPCPPRSSRCRPTSSRRLCVQATTDLTGDDVIAALRAPAAWTKCARKRPRADGQADRGADRNGASAAQNGAATNGAAGVRQQRTGIDLRRLDSLMNLIGELVITRTVGADHRRDRRRGAGRNDCADVATGGRFAGRDHDVPHGARGRCSTASRDSYVTRRDQRGRWTYDRRKGRRAGPVHARRGRSDRAPAAQRDRPRYRVARVRRGGKAGVGRPR